MKNIRVLPTKGTGAVYISKDVTPNLYSNWRGEGHHIYITSKEYIGLSYYLDGDLVRKGVIDDKDYWEVRKDYEKIILTTDPKLIEDGVQGIDSEFVMWFINNPTCERVEIQTDKVYNKNGDNISYYKIIIPQEGMNCWSGKKGVEGWPGKEEPKQETIEEIVETLDTNQMDKLDIFLNGMEWKDKQNKDLYDDLIDLLERLRPIYREDSDLHQKYEQKRLDLIEVLKKK
jgi:hypothetical protein